MLRSSSSRCHHHHGDNGDDVSEVTIDTALYEPPNQQWADQMARLKLELANTKAECDRAQWEHGQLLQKKQQADERISLLEKEKRELRGELREAERKCLILSMHGTTTAHPASPVHHQHHGDNNSVDGYSISSPNSVHSHSVTPYRTIHQDGEEDGGCDDGDDRINAAGWRHGKRDDDTHGGGSVASQQHHHHSSKNNITPIVDITSLTLGSSYNMDFDHRSTSDGLFEEMQDLPTRDIAMNDEPEREGKGSAQHDCCSRTLNTATSTKYSDDDPFATLNPGEDDEESVNANAGSWWSGWGWK